MSRRKGASGIRSGLSTALDSDAITPAETSSPPGPTSRGGQRKVVVAQEEPAGLRGTERIEEGDSIEKVTVTLPASLVRVLDQIVFERKRITRAYNRSALIQEAVAAFLVATNADNETERG